MANVMRTTIETVASPKWKSKLVRLLGSRRAIVAGDADLEVRGDDAAFDGVEAPHHVLRHHDGVGALSLGDGDRHRRTPLQLAIGEAGHGPGAMLRLGGPDRDVSHILDVDGPSVARRQQQEPDVGHALERLPGEDWKRLAPVAEGADEEGAIGVGELVDQLAQRHAIDGEALGIRLDADLVRAAADDIGRADIVDLGEFVLQLLRDLEERIVRPLAGAVRPRGQREVDDRHVIDAAADDQRLGDALGQFADMGADLLMHARDRSILIRADEEARGDDDAVVLGLRVDMLDAVDALDDVLERARHQLDRLVGLVAVGLDDDVDHRDADLRLFLARQRVERQRAGDDGRQQQERRQRRIDEGAGEQP